MSAGGSRIKICGLFRLRDAEPVNEAGPDYAGFVFFEKSPRDVSVERARELRRALRPSIAAVGGFVAAPAERIVRRRRVGPIAILPLHGGQDAAFIRELRRFLPGVPIWAAHRIRTGNDVRAAAESPADLVLLDGGGGCGRVFDWSLAEGFPRPFVLAGGLTPENIPEALGRFRPFAVDLSSGVETGGVKDGAKIRAAVAAARAGAREENNENWRPR